MRNKKIENHAKKTLRKMLDVFNTGMFVEYDKMKKLLINFAKYYQQNKTLQ